MTHECNLCLENNVLNISMKCCELSEVTIYTHVNIQMGIKIFQTEMEKHYLVVEVHFSFLYLRFLELLVPYRNPCL